MKKLLIATAAMAVVAGAQAQSSVTVYGLLDVNYTSNEKNKAGHNTLQSGQTLGESRLGFKGTEDLGSGLKAEFQLESKLDLTNGQAGTTGSTNTSNSNTTAAALFNREAWVGLSSASLGSVRVGRTDVTSAQAIDTNVSQAGDLAKDASLGADKGQTIRYTTPVIAGFKAEVGYSNESATTTTEPTAGRVQSAYIEYVAGNLGVYAGQTQVKVSNTVNDQKQTSYGIKYNFGPFALGAYQSTTDDTTNTGRELKQTRISAAAPVSALGSGVTAHAVYFRDSTANNAEILISTATGATAVQATNGYKLALTKAFSKRTTGYVGYVSTSDASTATTNDAKTYVVGVNHAF